MNHPPLEIGSSQRKVLALLVEKERELPENLLRAADRLYHKGLISFSGDDKRRSWSITKSGRELL